MCFHPPFLLRMPPIPGNVGVPGYWLDSYYTRCFLLLCGWTPWAHATRPASRAIIIGASHPTPPKREYTKLSFVRSFVRSPHSNRKKRVPSRVLMKGWRSRPYLSMLPLYSVMKCTTTLSTVVVVECHIFVLSGACASILFSSAELARSTR